jgi:hypothetical protein
MPKLTLVFNVHDDDFSTHMAGGHLPLCNTHSHIFRQKASGTTFIIGAD